MTKRNSDKHAQERKKLETSQDEKDRLNSQFKQLLSQLEDNPKKMYRRAEFKYIRDFVEYVSYHKDIYRRVMGDLACGLFDSSSESSDTDSNESGTLDHPISLCDSEDESASLTEPPSNT